MRDVPRFYMRPDKALSSLDAAFQRCDLQFVLLHAQDNFIAEIDSYALRKAAGMTTRPFSLTRCRVSVFTVTVCFI
jgi:hypothetical protein